MASPLAMALLQAQAGSGNPPPNVAQVAPTNIVGATSDYNTAMEQAYQAQLGQQNAMWGGLAGLGSAGILAGGKYLTGTGSGAAGAATDNTAADLADDLADGSAYYAPTAAGSVAGPVAAADAGVDAAADAGATAAAGGGSDLLASLMALFAA